MRIVSLLAENFKKLSVVRISPKNPVTKITGKNAQGKSSCLDAIQSALGGEKQTPPKPIRAGTEQARVVLDLVTHKITRRWWLDDDGVQKSALKVEQKDGQEVKKAQTWLSELIGVPAFDALNFSRLDGSAQAAILREVTGLDTTALDEEEEAVYAERTAVNREIKTLKGKLDGMEEPDEVADPGKEEDVTVFVKRLGEANAKNTANAESRRKLKDLTDEATRKRKELDDLRERIKVVETEIDVLNGRISKGQAVVDALADVDTSEIEAAAKAAQDRNKAIRAAREKKAEADRKANEIAVQQQQLEERQRVADSHTQRLKEIEKERGDLLAKAAFPVDGITIKRDNVFLNGVPFEQASSRQKIVAGLEIALALNPKLRVVLIRDGSLLDEESLAWVEAWATEKDAQVFMEIVGSDDPAAITIEEGAIKK